MPTLEPKHMSSTTSFMLDVLRLMASLTVMFSHAADMWFPQLNSESGGGTFAHAAVIIFFVISGYVISYTTSVNQRDATQYAVARIAKLTSVTYPALLFTLFVQFLLDFTNPLFLNTYDRGYNTIRYILVATFTNEIWLFSAAPPINAPLWSISFEFWYYIIFGVLLYKRNNTFGFLLLFISFLIAGPKIIAMMPIWLMGCIVYKISPPKLNTVVGCGMFLGLFGFIILTILFLKPIPGQIGAAPLFFANQFVSDWILGLLVAIAIWIIPAKEYNLLSDKIFTMKFRRIADLTFPLYVFHYPMLVLFRSLSIFEEHNILQYIVVVCSIILLSSLIGIIINSQKVKWNNLWKSILTVPKTRNNAE